jgi:hypothetical protein
LQTDKVHKNVADSLADSISLLRDAHTVRLQAANRCTWSKAKANNYLGGLLDFMTTLEVPTVTILASGVALGVYVPALLLANQLQRYNIPTEICVLESYYKSECLQGLLKHKLAYQQNFSLALTARKIPHDIRASLDMNSIQVLLKNWHNEQRKHFIVWSGFWLPILEDYSSQVNLHSLNIDFCRIDAAITPSFKQYCNSFLKRREIWFWQLEREELVNDLPVIERQPRLWNDRHERYLLHGGGWGLGNYLNKACELEQHGFALNVIVRDTQVIITPLQGNRYLRINPSWFPWDQKKGESLQFPPLEEWDGISFQPLSSDLNQHLLIPLMEECKAVISKPGGGTLIDAYGTATPLVMLEPYGESEKANSVLWAQLGYGIAYDEWKRTGFSSSVLAKIHQNLLERKQTINYPQSYAKDMCENLKENLFPCLRTT